jgi:3-deoxy-D-manno-octulosonic-acid transferase
MHFLYSVGLGLALVLSLPYWLLRMARQGKYRAGLGQRLGRAPAHLRSSRGAIWVHAVSVGEVLAVAGLIEQLRRRWPKRRVVVSTTTATGQALAQRRFGAENVFYFPLDFAFAIRPYLRKLRPELVVVAETEFWPNFLRLSRHADAQIAVVNARISDRSFPRYRRVPPLPGGGARRRERIPGSERGRQTAIDCNRRAGRSRASQRQSEIRYSTPAGASHHRELTRGPGARRRRSGDCLRQHGGR